MFDGIIVCIFEDLINFVYSPVEDPEGIVRTDRGAVDLLV